MATSVVDTETGRKTARVSPAVARNIEQVSDAHRALDERKPPRAWTKPMEREQVDHEVLGLIQHYEQAF